MDKVAFYEEVILGNVFEEETENVEKTAEEEFVDAVADRVIEKIAATKFKEVLQTGMLPGGAKASGSTKKILSFNQKDGRFDKPMHTPGVGSRGASPLEKLDNNPTRNITRAKMDKNVFLSPFSGNRKVNKAENAFQQKSDAFLGAAHRNSLGKPAKPAYHGEKNIMQSSYDKKYNFNGGLIKYR